MSDLGIDLPVPVVPVVPEVPGVPLPVPEIPVIPELPLPVPEVPGVPLPVVPEVPGLPLPIPEVPGLPLPVPEVPELPLPVPEIPAAPVVPELPLPVPGVPGLYPISDIGELNHLIDNLSYDGLKGLGTLEDYIDLLKKKQSLIAAVESNSLSLESITKHTDTLRSVENVIDRLACELRLPETCPGIDSVWKIRDSLDAIERIKAKFSELNNIIERLSSATPPENHGFLEEISKLSNATEGVSKYITHFMNKESAAPESAQISEERSQLIAKAIDNLDALKGTFKEPTVEEQAAIKEITERYSALDVKEKDAINKANSLIDSLTKQYQ